MEIKRKWLKVETVLHLIFRPELAYAAFQKSFQNLFLFFKILAKFEELHIELKY